MKRTLLAGLVVLGAAILVAAGLVLRPQPAPSPTTPVTGAVPPPAATPPAGARIARATTPPPVAATPPQTTDLHQAAPVWTVDKAASRLSFRGVMNGAPFDGVFRSWDAQIAFDPKNLANSRATITVDTTSALTGQPIKDAALPNSEWLSTAAFPQAMLVTRSITATGPDRYQATAVVHIRGVAWRTSVPFDVSISHDMGRMQSTLTLDRRTFGIGEGPFRSPPPVEPQVQVSMRLLAKRDR